MKPEQLLKKVFPPMLATLADGPPASDAGWTYELKYDGFRALIAVAGGKLAMWSRNEIDLSSRFPAIAAAVQKLELGDVVLDGEIVALDETGTPRFQLLQQGNREKLFVFDILWHGGVDLRTRPYLERRKLLEKLLGRLRGTVVVAQRIPKSGAEALAEAAKTGWEGIIAKRNDAPYENRRSKAWLKVKAQSQQEFAIVGWQPSTHSSREIGSLHLGYLGEDRKLHYAGKVGTGFSAKQRVWFKDELAKDVVSKALVEGAPRIRTATWVKPRFVGQVSFTEWTADGRLRHPSFLGLRDDKAPGEVVREKPVHITTGESKPARAQTKRAASKKSSTKKSATKESSGAPAVVLSNPDRLLYPRDGITKADLAEYYDAVAGPMIAALAGRPLSLEHWNQGIDHASWFHQNLGREAPSWLTTIETPTRTSSRRNVRHLVVDSRESLRWLAQMSVLTVHMWHSHEGSLDQPDWVVFDLDPAKGKGIEQAIEVALVMRKVLDQLELPSVPKTSGKRGIHVFVPLAPGSTHEEAGDFALTLATAVTRSVPEMTVERSLDKRNGRLYLDAMQNAYGKTIVAPYSPRAIDGAPVSAPLEWSEVTKRLDPLKFNIRTMPNRLAKKGDLFQRVFEQRAKLPKLK